MDVEQGITDSSVEVVERVEASHCEMSNLKIALFGTSTTKWGSEIP